jgi:Tol biopolymer transport system component
MDSNKSTKFFILSSILSLAVVSILGSCGGATPGDGEPIPGPKPPPGGNTNFVVFIADKETNGKVELYKYTLATSTTSKVNDLLIAAGNVTSFAISPDRKWIAYVADQDTDEVFELYVAPADGTSSAIKVSGTLIAGGDVSDDVVWAPNSSRIAYRNNGSTAAQFDLTTVTPLGTDRVNVTAAGAGLGNVISNSYTWSPDSLTVGYMSDQASAAIELWTNSGSTQTNNTQVNGNIVLNGDVTEYAWAPDGSKIVYRADQVVNGTFELYTSMPNGTVNTPVGGVTGTGIASNVEVGSIVWAPNSSRIAYRADLVTDELFNLHTVLPDGTGRVKVNLNLTGNKDVVGTPSWSPDSSRLAYLSDSNIDEVFELLASQPTVANTSIQINSTLLGGSVSTGPTQDTPPAWSPNSSFVAYIAEQDSAGVAEVYAGQPNGMGNIKFSGSMASGGNASLGVAGEVWAPTLSIVQYRADQLLAGTDELWTSDGTTIPRVSVTPAVTTGLKTFAKWSPDSGYLVYASEGDTVGVVELYMSTKGGSTKQKISGFMTSGGNVNELTFKWAP